jgi:hypothetical protein
VEPNGGAVTPKRSGGFIVVTISVRPIFEAHMLITVLIIGALLLLSSGIERNIMSVVNIL